MSYTGSQIDWLKPTAQLLGTFQPWTDEHTELFKKGIEEVGQVVVMIRLVPVDEDNPYTIDDKIIDISMKLAQAGFDTRQYTIITVPNITYFS